MADLMTRALAIGLLVALAACDPYALKRREALDQSFVGAGEADLVRLLGVPSRTIVVGDHRFLAYDEQRTEIQPPLYPWQPWGWGYGPGFGPGFGGLPSQVIHYTCETTFEVADGRVIGFTLRGNACG
jgi:hypothetical protein